MPVPTPQEQSTLLFNVWTLLYHVGSFLDEAIAESGLSSDDFGFYSLVRWEQPVTPSRIAELSGMPATTVSSYLNRIEVRGHLIRRRNPSDGRSTLVELTEAGREVHEVAVQCFLPAQRAVEKELAVPVADAIETLQQVAAAIRAVAAERKTIA